MTLVNYGGLEVSNGSFTGAAGTMLNNNVKLLADSYATDNVLHNADFNFFQRQVPGTATSFTSLNYTADRWWAYCETGSCQSSQATGNTGSQNALQIKNTTTLQGVMIGQWVEAKQSINFQSETVRFQIWVNSSSAQTVQINVYEWQGTADAPAYTSGKFSVSSHVITYSGTSIVSDASNTASVSANTWTSIYVEAAVTSSANNILVAVQAPIAATTGTLTVSQAQLLPASTTATNGLSKWVANPVGLDFLQCQRFFCTNATLGNAPANNYTLNESYLGTYFTATSCYTQLVQFPTQMRASPTVTFYSSSNANTSGEWATTVGSYVAGTTTSDGQSANGMRVGIVVSGKTAGQSCLVKGIYTATADL